MCSQFDTSVGHQLLSNKSDIKSNAMDEDISNKKQAPDVPKLNKNTVVAKWDETSCIHTSENVADVTTKPLSGGKRKKFVRMLLHHIYDDVA